MLLVDPLKRVTISGFALTRGSSCTSRGTWSSRRRTPRAGDERGRGDAGHGREPRVQREHVVDALRHQLRNKATVAYFLLLDNRRNVFGGYLGEFEAGELTSSSASSAQVGGVNDPNMGGKGAAVGPRRPSRVRAHLVQQRLVAEQRWMIGSTTRMAPAEVMAEIFRALRAMDESWKKLGPYNLKCLYKMAGRIAAHRGWR